MKAFRSRRPCECGVCGLAIRRATLIVYGRWVRELKGHRHDLETDRIVPETFASVYRFAHEACVQEEERSK